MLWLNQGTSISWQWWHLVQQIFLAGKSKETFLFYWKNCAANILQTLTSE